MSEFNTAAGILLVVLLVVLIVAAICSARVRGVILGGKPAVRKLPKSPHIVVDTLNLAHWFQNEDSHPLSISTIVSTIDQTAAVLKKKHPGRVMYVLKDRESQLNTEEAHQMYMLCAERNGVYIIIAEKYADPPRGNAHSNAHSAGGRDDFLIAVLANRWKCAALTEDQLRDFKEFRTTLQPFYALELAYWRTRALREFYRPESTAYSRLRKPHTLHFSEYF
jgi:hypothetical protein